MTATLSFMADLYTIKQQQGWLSSMLATLEKKIIGFVPEYSHTEFHQVWLNLKSRSHKHEIIANLMESGDIRSGKKGINVAGLLRAAQMVDEGISMGDVRDILAEAQRAFWEYE